MKAVVFDFCDTIVNFQTADRFVYYVLEHLKDKKIRHRKILLEKIRKCSFVKNLDKITNGKYSLNKRIILWQLRGISKQELDCYAESYYKNEIVPNLYEEILKIIENYRENNYFVYLASGGYDLYLKHFISEFGFTDCFCTKLKFVKERFTGRIEGWDCVGENKTKLLKQYFRKPLEEKVVYTDSKSDLPLLLWADKGIVVSKKGYRTWTKEYGLEEYLLSAAGKE